MLRTLSFREWTPSARASRVIAAAALVLAALPSLTRAQAPPTYYNSVDNSTPASLRATLHEVIDDHARFPYTSGGTDTWDILELADEDPNNSSNILDVYRNASYAKQGGGNSNYDREHTWPSSYGFPDDNSSNMPFTDAHQLRLCNSSYNSSRGNKPFKTSSIAGSERVTEMNNGKGGGVGVYPGQSNWTSGSGPSGIWETWIGRRGDVARSLFYLDVRYEGGLHGLTGVSEPDLILTDNVALISASNTGSNEPVAYMGLVSVLYQWHLQDPVDADEQARNDVIFGFQGNRNPFVDHPEWADCLFGPSCSIDMIPPAAPTGLVATGQAGAVDLDWDDNSEPDIFGYRVQRSTSMGGPYTDISGLVAVSDYLDSAVIPGTTYYYVISASDTSGNPSNISGEDSATPLMGVAAAALPWINELHYDNASTDVGEFIEVAGRTGLDLGGWKLELYNGSGGAMYDSRLLSGVIANQGDCFGAISFDFGQIQNGGPDGIALVDPMGSVIEFLSYEGSFIAADGSAVGLTSTDIGVAEDFTTVAGTSLQLGGSGHEGGDFFWQASQLETPDAVNLGQSYTNPAWVDLGFGLAGITGEPLLVGCGSLDAGLGAALSLTNARPFSTAFVVGGLSQLNAPLKGGTLVPNFSPGVVKGFPTNASGAFLIDTLWPAGVPSGADVYFQYWVLDAAGPVGFSASNALRGTTP
ncbi:MAG: hypothetical protein DHS20C15_27120 [Planctomycetota bacterium]|nr:MAG: hypothetical protein DHS20C15_27120 [Planctomycetota bacterium]